MSGIQHQIIELATSEVDRVAPLFKQLSSFHRDVIAGAWPVRDEEAAWTYRRQRYLEWLGEGRAIMLVAVPVADPGAMPAGYAVLSTKAAPAGWDVGERIGELETLSVAEPARGEGIGTMLIEACRERLRAEGIGYWSVAVVHANEDAIRLYERMGFHPYYRQLLAEL